MTVISLSDMDATGPSGPVLGIESSCDETAAAVYDPGRGLLAHQLHSQVERHRPYGGVVPELASRDHVRFCLPLVEAVLAESGLAGDGLAGIAYTAGPGLVGALMVGAAIGRSLAFAWGLPAVAVHHLEAHLFAPMLDEPRPDFPFLALLVSGGHTLLARVDGLGRYEVLGQTLDDAVGEAFDKTGKLLGLGYPAGPALESLARRGRAIPAFPRPMTDRPGLDFSFSGLKTHAMVTLAADPDPSRRADIARAFQEAVVDTLRIKCRRALRQTGLERLVVAGGVGANAALRRGLADMAAAESAEVFFPRQAFCTDNAAMVALLGGWRLCAGERVRGAGFEVRPRWGLGDGGESRLDLRPCIRSFMTSSRDGTI